MRTPTPYTRRTKKTTSINGTLPPSAVVWTSSPPRNLAERWERPPSLIEPEPQARLDSRSSARGEDATLIVGTLGGASAGAFGRIGISTGLLTLLRRPVALECEEDAVTYESSNAAIATGTKGRVWRGPRRVWWRWYTRHRRLEGGSASREEKSVFLVDWVWRRKCCGCLFALCCQPRVAACMLRVRIRSEAGSGPDPSPNGSLLWSGRLQGVTSGSGSPQAGVTTGLFFFLFLLFCFGLELLFAFSDRTNLTLTTQPVIKTPVSKGGTDNQSLPTRAPARCFSLLHQYTQSPNRVGG